MNVIPSILHLSLQEAPFKVMVTGEKNKEYRLPTDWIMKRLFDKNGNPRTYDYVKFTNGYGSHRPSFTCEFKGFYEYTFDNPIKKQYSNGFKFIINKGHFIIELGIIISKHNC